MLKAVEKFEKPKTAKAAGSAKKQAAAKAPAKKASAKRAAPSNDSEKVLQIIKRAKKGASITTLKTKTDFNAKKISNIIYRGLKQGVIKRVGKGVYAAS